MNVSVYKFSQLMVAFIILKQIGYTGHNSIQQITEIHLCLHENRGDLIILQCKKTQFSVCIRRVISFGQLRPVCDAKGCNANSVDLSGLGTALGCGWRLLLIIIWIKIFIMYFVDMSIFIFTKNWVYAI